jgi:hypothetical protein
MVLPKHTQLWVLSVLKFGFITVKHCRDSSPLILRLRVLVLPVLRVAETAVAAETTAVTEAEGEDKCSVLREYVTVR